MGNVWIKRHKRTVHTDSLLPASGDGTCDELIGQNDTKRSVAKKLMQRDAMRALLMPSRDRYEQATAFEALKSEAQQSDTPRKAQKAAWQNAEALIKAYLLQAL